MIPDENTLRKLFMKFVIDTDTYDHIWLLNFRGYGKMDAKNRMLRLNVNGTFDYHHRDFMMETEFRKWVNIIEYVDNKSELFTPRKVIQVELDDNDSKPNETVQQVITAHQEPSAVLPVVDVGIKEPTIYPADYRKQISTDGWEDH